MVVTLVETVSLNRIVMVLNCSPDVPSDTLVNTFAVAVVGDHATKCHAVPSLAIAQFAVPRSGKETKMFCAATVFGVVVTPRNVTVFESPIDHDPVNVQTRKIFLESAAPRIPYAIGRPSRSPPSISRTTRAIRSAAGFVNVTRWVPADLPSGFWAMLHHADA